jgi:hypothetical protein
MSKNKTIREKILKYPLNKWPSEKKKKYFKWVKETYGDVAEPTSYVDGYRAWKQVVWATDERIYNKKPTQILTSAAFVAEAQKILDGLFEEEYVKNEHNLTGL